MRLVTLAISVFLFASCNRESGFISSATSPYDSVKAAQSQIVLRVERVDRGEGSKYLWPTIRVLEVIKNSTKFSFSGEMEVAHYSFGKGIPEGISTIYLHQYNETDIDKNLWALVEDSGKSKGFSHNSPSK